MSEEDQKIENTLNKNKQRQAELRRIQLERDKDRSFGSDYKNPCKKVKYRNFNTNSICL